METVPAAGTTRSRPPTTINIGEVTFVISSRRTPGGIDCSGLARIRASIRVAVSAEDGSYRTGCSWWSRSVRRISEREEDRLAVQRLGAATDHLQRCLFLDRTGNARS